MKYEIAIQNQFQFEWLEDLENEKLGAVELVLKIVLDFSIHQPLGIGCPFIEQGGQGVYLRRVPKAFFQQIDHPQEFSHTHQGKGAHVHGDDDPVGRSQGIEGQETETWRAVDNDVVIGQAGGGKG